MLIFDIKDLYFALRVLSLWMFLIGCHNHGGLQMDPNKPSTSRDQPSIADNEVPEDSWTGPFGLHRQLGLGSLHLSPGDPDGSEQWFRDHLPCLIRQAFMEALGGILPAMISQVNQTDIENIFPPQVLQWMHIQTYQANVESMVPPLTEEERSKHSAIERMNLIEARIGEEVKQKIRQPIFDSIRGTLNSFGRFPEATIEHYLSTVNITPQHMDEWIRSFFMRLKDILASNCLGFEGCCSQSADVHITRHLNKHHPKEAGKRVLETGHCMIECPECKQLITNKQRSVLACTFHRHMEVCKPIFDLGICKAYIAKYGRGNQVEKKPKKK